MDTEPGKSQPGQNGARVGTGETPIELDDLDRRILEHFRPRYPRPGKISPNLYMSSEDIERPCTHPEPYNLPASDTNKNLVEQFTSDNRYGHCGRWCDFLPFLPYALMYHRRHKLLDIGVFERLLLHTGPNGTVLGEQGRVLVTMRNKYEEFLSRGDRQSFVVRLPRFT
jgi:hypothetical protein